MKAQTHRSRQKEAAGVSGVELLAALCEEDDTRGWFERGAHVLLWWDSLAHDAAGEAAFSGSRALLGAYCERHAQTVPRLLLADLLLRSSSPEFSEIVPLLDAALLDLAWLRRPEWLAVWSHHVAAGLGLLLRLASVQGEPEEVERWRRLALQLPWERAHRGLSPHWLHTLCTALGAVGAWEAVARLTERMARACGDWPSWRLWRGWSLAHMGDHDAAIAAIQDAFGGAADGSQETEAGALPRDDELWCGLTHYLVVHEQLALAEKALLQVEGRESLAFDWAALSYCVALGATTEALRLCEALDDALSSSHLCIEIKAGLLIDDGAYADAESLLDAAIEGLQVVGEVPGGRPKGEAGRGVSASEVRLRLLRGFVWLHSDRTGPAIAAFRRLWSQLQVPRFDGLTLDPEVGHPGIWWTPGRLWRLLMAYGNGCASLDYDSEALACFLQGLQIAPRPSLFQRACGLLFKHHQFDDAARLLKQAVALFPASEAIRYGLFLLAARGQHWDEARGHLDAIGQPWFEARGLQREWLFGQIQIALGAGDVLGAFVACESMLDDVLAEPSLRELREQIVVQLQAQFAELQQRLGERDTRRHREHQLQAQLDLVMAQHRTQRDAFSQLLAAQAQHDTNEGLRQSLEPSAPQDPEEALAQMHPDIAASLSDESRKALASALFLWRQLNASGAAEHDFGPVVLQLARAVEGEVNRCLIDPLLGLALQEGGALGDFPPVSIGALAPEGNHLSLGDAARLLYHKIEVKEADGSVSIERNPHSQERHLRWLQRWWESPPCAGLAASSPGLLDAVQQQLPRDLQRLAGLRNQAGHAGAALDRSQADEAIRLVLGSSVRPGLVHLTSAVSQAM